MAFGVGPGYNLFQGSFKVMSDAIPVEYKQIYDSMITTSEIEKDVITIRRDSIHQWVLLFKGVDFIQTSHYDKYSKAMIDGRIAMALVAVMKD